MYIYVYIKWKTNNNNTTQRNNNVGPLFFIWHTNCQHQKFCLYGYVKKDQSRPFEKGLFEKKAFTLRYDEDIFIGV